MTKILILSTEPHVPASPAVLSWPQHGPASPLNPLNQATRSKRLALRIYA
jgi:hypothetical protein